MESEKAILQLMNEYCFAIDSGDLVAFGILFAHAEWIAEGKRPGKESANNLIIYADGTPRTKHSISNIRIDIDERNGNATAHSYVTVWQQTDDFPLQAIFAGDYFDEFARVKGEWRFTKRELINSLIGDMSAHLKVPSLTIPTAK